MVKDFSAVAVETSIVARITSALYTDGYSSTFVDLRVSLSSVDQVLEPLW